MRRSRLLAVVFKRMNAILLVSSLVAGVLCLMPEAVTAATAGTITSAGPLTTITNSTSLKCNVQLLGAVAVEFPEEYGCATLLIEGSSGGRIAFQPNGFHHAPDTWAENGSFFVPTSQSLTGAGTSVDPYKLTTVVTGKQDANNPTRFQLTQVDSYVVGSTSFRTDVMVKNVGERTYSTANPLHLYRLVDCSVDYEDPGYGYDDPVTQTTGCHASDGQFDKLKPIYDSKSTIVPARLSGDTSVVLRAIEWATDFATVYPGKNCDCTNKLFSSAASLGWQLNLAPGQSTTLSSQMTVEHTAPIPDPVVQTFTGGDVQPSEQKGGSNPAETAQQPCKCADPVSTLDGNFYETFTDFAIPGRGPTLGLLRTYNATSASTDSAFGYGWTFNYGMSVDASTSTGTPIVYQENGSSTTFTLANGAYTAPPRVDATLVQNSDGTWTFKRNGADSFVFDALGRLSSITDPNGYTTTLNRPNSTSLVAKDAAGRALTFTFSGARITAVKDPAGRAASYVYDANGNLVEIIDAGGGHTKMTYDGAHLMITRRLPKYASDTTTVPSPVMTNHYDALHRVDWQTDELGRKTLFNYTTAPGSTIVTNPKGNATMFTYKAGVMTARVDGYGSGLQHTTTFAYDVDTAQITKTQYADGSSTSSAYDNAGNMLNETDALGNASSSTYNLLHEPLVAIDPRGQVSTRTYSSAGNVLTVDAASAIGAEHHTTTYAYGDATHPGDLTSVTDPNGHKTTFAYNAYGDLISTTDADGNKTTMAYNSPVSIGWVTSSTAANGNASGATASQYANSVTRDAFGRVLTSKDPLWDPASPVAHQNVLTYDANGNTMSSTDGVGRKTSYTYNAANELLMTTRPDGTTLKTEYWPDGSLKTHIDGKGNSTAYAYDVLGQLASTTDALKRVTYYKYDVVGNLVLKTDAGGSCGTTPASCTTYTYDKNHQLLTVAYSDGTPGVSYRYDSLGRVVERIDGTGTSTSTYDDYGRLTSQVNGANSQIQYGYDKTGNQTSVTYPGGKAITRIFDAANRFVSLTDWNGKTNVFTYDANGNLLTSKDANGVLATSMYDRADELMNINNAVNGWSLAGYNAAYDGAGQVTLMGTTGYVAQASVSYSYDQVNRVVAGGTAKYAYDGADNPTTVAGNATQTFDAANQLTSSTANSGTAYGYDTRGNRTSVTPTNGVKSTYTYNLVNQMKAASSTPNAATSYNAAVTADSPGAYYRLNDSSATAFASVKGTYPGSFAGAVTRQVVGGLRGDSDTAVNFNNSVGEGNFTTSPASVAANGDTTVEMLMRHDGAVSGSEALFAFKNNYMLVLKNGKIGFSTKADLSDVYGADVSTLVNQWMHVVAVFHNGAVTASKLYINGQLQTLTQMSGTPASTSLIATSTATFSGTAGGTNHFNGSLDELAIYGSALLADRVVAHYQASQAYSATYGYNGDGLRMSKTVGGKTTQYTWDASAGLPLLAFDGDTYYVYGPDGLPLEQIKASDNTTQWYGHDTLGNTRILTDSTATKVAQYDYDTYGNLIASAGRVDTPLKYRGEYADRETGLTYLRARYYDPSTAQFTTRDPLVSTTRSAYGYVADSPLNYTDPSGLNKKPPKAPNWKKADDKYLKRNNIDPHTVKEGLGKGWDLWEDKNTGKIYARDKGGTSEPDDTGYVLPGKQFIDEFDCDSDMSTPPIIVAKMPGYDDKVDVAHNDIFSLPRIEVSPKDVAVGLGGIGLAVLGGFASVEGLNPMGAEA